MRTAKMAWGDHSPDLEKVIQAAASLLKAQAAKCPHTIFGTWAERRAVMEELYPELFGAEGGKASEA
jgi:hypothetical protein